MVLGRTVGPRAAGLLMNVCRRARPRPRPRPRPVVAPNPHASQELFISGDKYCPGAGLWVWVGGTVDFKFYG